VSLFRRSIESPAYPLTSQYLADILGATTAAGVAVSERSAFTYSAVYRAVATIAGQAAGLPLKTYRDNQTTGQREDTRLPLLEAPYPDCTPYVFWETVYTDLLTWGNSYLFKVKSEMGGPYDIARLLRLPPADVTVSRDEGTARNPSGKQFKVAGYEGDPFTPNEVMHIPGMGYDGLVGLSPVQCAKQGIGVALAAEEAAGQLWQNGILASGILKSDRELKPEVAQGLAEAFKTALRGFRNTGKVAVLDRGVTFDQLTIPPADAQFLESREFQVEEIARWYGITPALLMDRTASMNWGENAQRQFVMFTLNPWLKRVEQSATLHLCPEATFAEYTRAGLLEADVAVQAQAFATGIQFGYLSPGEVRRYLNLPVTDPALDEFLRPVNMQSTDLGGEPDLSAKVEAVGALVRAGFDPAAALAAVGLPAITHLGLLPVTLQKEEMFDAEADAAAAATEEGAPADA
jgi:HK97 family phage portal protein